MNVKNDFEPVTVFNLAIVPVKEPEASDADLEIRLKSLESRRIRISELLHRFAEHVRN